MTSFLHPNDKFLRQLIAIIEENLSDEQFGVPELADRVSMSRSNLLRKVKKLTDVSVSVFIRKVRLHRAKEMLGNDTLTASEVGYRVGFSSTSYFTKCYREEFGYTPGEHKNQDSLISLSINKDASHKRQWSKWVAIATFVLVFVVIVSYLLRNENLSRQPLDKSIAVLPFKNDSNDSANVYIINGLMEAILNNLQKVKELKVTSRTTMERYRNIPKTIRELSDDLEVNYFVEGSGQKIGDEIVLTVQLIEAPTDKHLWSKSYRRKVGDIFQLQMDVAKNIAEEIEVVITPEEQKRIEKKPTKNLIAYDYYLQGLEFTHDETGKGLVKAIELYKKAIKEDSVFAQPYAYIAICYYYLDIYQIDKKYAEEINTYADKALLLDSDIAESYIAKALFYMHDAQYPLAIQYFEKALTYSNSGWIHNFLSDIYTSYIPNTQKYLMHALRGIKTSVASQDSITASYSYLHLSNALAQTGFIKESEKYVLKSLEYNSQNLYSQYLYVYIKLVKNFDLKEAKSELISILQNDTTRLDIIQEIAKVCYTMEDYTEAWEYYEKFTIAREKYQLDIYRGEDIKIGFVLDQLNRHKEALAYYENYKQSADKDESIYKELMYAAYNAVNGNINEGIVHLKTFSNKKGYLYWVVLFLDKDPILLKLSSHPDYKSTIQQISDNFWAEHRETAEMLREEGVI